MNSTTENRQEDNRSITGTPLEGLISHSTAEEIERFIFSLNMLQTIPATREAQALLGGATIRETMERANRQSIENLLKAGVDRELTGLLVLHLMNLSVSYIGQTIQSNEAPELIELLKESAQEETTEERRTEIESLITENNRLSGLMFVGLLDQLNEKEKTTIEKQLRENEAFKVLTGGTGKTDIDIDLCALNAADHENIDILKEYCDRLNECIENYTIRRAGGSFYYVPKRKEYTTAGKLEQLRKETGLKIATVPDVLPEPTLKGYVRALKPWQNKTGQTENKAGLSQRLQDLIVTDAGKMLNPKGRDITGQYWTMVRNGDIETQIKDTALISTAFSIAAKMKEDAGAIPEVLHVRVEDLTKALYGPEQRHDKTAEIISRIVKESKTIGLLEGTGIYPVITFQGYNETARTLSFSFPYFRQMLDNMDKARQQIADNNKIANKKRSKFYQLPEKPEDLPALHFLIKSSLNLVRNKPAAAIVRELVQYIERIGYEKKRRNGRIWYEYKTDQKKRDKIPRISVNELINRVPELEQALKESTNKPRDINRIFTYVWDYMNAHTDIKEKWPALIFPGCNMPEVKKLNNEQRAAWLPTMRTKDTLVFEFRLMSKDDQLNSLENILK